jgi:hypothetical protein|tara:strand:- start:1465 stop:2397 length:933 start_codon:yes stop_codon:yes gene_type:complete
MSFGFGANPYQMSSSQISQQGIDLASAQAPPKADDAGGDEAVGAIDAFTGIAQGQKGLREVLDGVKRGKEMAQQGVQHVINRVQNVSSAVPAERGVAQDGFNHAPLLGRPGSSIEMSDMSSGGTSLTRPTPSGASATDADGNAHLTPTPRSVPDMADATGGGLPSGPVPKMNVGTIMNGTAGDANALAGQTADAVQGGMSNLHAKVQSGLDKIGELSTKVDAGLDTGISTAEGVLDAMGPIGDVAGLFTGIYGAYKAHRDRVEEDEHAQSVRQGISNVQGSANIPNTNVANIGKQTAGLTSQLQSVSAHF